MHRLIPVVMVIIFGFPSIFLYEYFGLYEVIDGGILGLLTGSFWLIVGFFVEEYIKGQ